MSQDSKVKLIEELLSLGSEELIRSFRMPGTKTKMLGKDVQHLYSSSDTNGRCPTCYTSTVTKIGKLSIDGTEQDVCKCNSCNRLFSGADGGVRSLLEEAASVYGTDKVGFNTIDNGQLTPNMSINDPPDYVAHSHLSSIKASTQDMSSQLSSLIITISNLVKQNNDLMEKLATDPLAGMKKAINNFNLE